MAKIITTMSSPSIPPQDLGVSVEDPDYICYVLEQLGSTEDGRMWHSVPDGFLEAFLEKDQEDGVDIQTPDASEIAENRKKLNAYKQINLDVKEAIRNKYSTDEEMKALRTDDADYKAFVEECVAVGTAKKVALGLK
jgi:hypothetical protein|tara:strand:+ start:191 stop:601 length:411 start_codon:yes stop_codon:yes gene_type:complete